MKRRSRFEIELPEDAAQDAPARRRGPMASAIGENAGALAERAEAEAAIRAENDALAAELVRLRELGLVIREVPLGDVMMDRLSRDRAPGPDPDLDELVTSIRETGLSNPIRVEERADGKVELVQGYRRLSAFRRLAETDGRFAAIPAAVLPRGEDLSAAYRRMVDENVIRRDLSFAEMALAARRYADDPDIPTHEFDVAVRELFASASYQKRSYIRSFGRLMSVLGPHLKHPQALPRALGLAVLKKIEEGEGAHVAPALDAAPGRSAAQELDILREAVGAEAPPARPAKGQGTRRPRVTFEVSTPDGPVRCTAGVGRLEIRLPHDLTDMERGRLERAVKALIAELS